MNEVINLRTARKRADRRKAETQAAENRYVHGASKTERSLTEARQDKSLRDHEQHRIETGEMK
jgi:hypothetical protein